MVIVTVAVSLTPSSSVIVYVNVSVPSSPSSKKLNAALTVYSKAPSSLTDKRAPDARVICSPDNKVTPLIAETVKLSPNGSLSIPLLLFANKFPLMLPPEASPVRPSSSVSKLSSCAIGRTGSTTASRKSRSALSGIIDPAVASKSASGKYPFAAFNVSLIFSLTTKPSFTLPSIAASY